MSAEQLVKAFDRVAYMVDAIEKFAAGLEHGYERGALNALCQHAVADMDELRGQVEEVTGITPQS